MSSSNQGILAAGLYASVAALRQAPPPAIQRYARVLSPGGSPSRLFRFVVGDASTDDGHTAIVPTLGGGAWLDVPDDDRGDDITTASGSLTIGVYGGPWRVIPASTLSGSLTLALDLYYSDGATLVRRGSVLEVTRLDVSAHAVTITSGVSGTTICTMPTSSQAWARFTFDGAAWVKRAAGTMI